MAYVSRGPVSTLPGAFHATEEGMMCDTHADRPAVKRVQGETDSFGAEFSDLCQECLDEFKAQQKSSYEGWRCDWCKHANHGIRPKRDWEEGAAGPVYYVCKDCSDSYDKRLQEELDDMHDESIDWDDGCDDEPLQMSDEELALYEADVKAYEAEAEAEPSNQRDVVRQSLHQELRTFAKKVIGSSNLTLLDNVMVVTRTHKKFAVKGDAP